LLFLLPERRLYLNLVSKVATVARYSCHGAVGEASTADMRIIY
jgi:hypothetical protein